MTTTFNENRAQDRKYMAETISTIAADCGATVTCEAGPREISLDVATPDGLQVCVEFDGRSLQPNIYVLSWHMDFKSSKRLNPDTFGGNVNTCHFKKATYVAYGFEDLCDQFTFGLLLAKDGRAFLPEVERLAA